MKKNEVIIKRGSTLILKAVIVLLGLTVLGLCGLILIPLSKGVTGGYMPILLGLYVAAIPFFYALYQAFQLLQLIDKNKAFSGLAVTALKNIKYCAIAIWALFTLGSPYIFMVADQDDAPGVVAINIIIAGTSFVIAIFAAVLEKLFQNAIDIKTENDLTV